MRTLTVVALLLTSACSSTPPPVARAFADIEQRMASHRVPAVSVAVIEGGRVVFANAWGVADVRSGARASKTTIFQAASISKPITATAALSMVGNGLLSLDEDVNVKLRSWKIPPHEFGTAVTLRHLLSHTAGFKTSGFVQGYALGQPLPTTVQVLAGEPPANTPPVQVVVEPGSEHSYSAAGYTVAQLLLMDLAGTTFPTLMRQRVLDPIGMRASTFEQELPPPIRARLAIGHQNDGTPVNGGYVRNAEIAAGGLFSTPTDIARWILALDGNTLLSPAAKRAMLTEVKNGYGLGLTLFRAGNLVVMTHSGSFHGYRSQFIYAFAPRRQGLVVMTNSDNADPLIDEIVAAVGKVYGWPM